MHSPCRRSRPWQSIEVSSLPACCTISAATAARSIGVVRTWARPPIHHQRLANDGLPYISVREECLACSRFAWSRRSKGDRTTFNYSFLRRSTFSYWSRGAEICCRRWFTPRTTRDQKHKKCSNGRTSEHARCAQVDQRPLPRIDRRPPAYQVVIGSGYNFAVASDPTALSDARRGWRIVKTMGTKITRLKPVQGFCAETAGPLTDTG
jgi:hypothetical protein